MPMTVKFAAATLAFDAATPASLRSSSGKVPHTCEIGALKRFCSSTAACTPLTHFLAVFLQRPGQRHVNGDRELLQELLLIDRLSRNDLCARSLRRTAASPPPMPPR